MGFAGIKTSSIIPTDEENVFTILIVKYIKNCKDLPQLCITKQPFNHRSPTQDQRSALITTNTMASAAKVSRSQTSPRHS